VTGAGKEAGETSQSLARSAGCASLAARRGSEPPGSTTKMEAVQVTPPPPCGVV